MSEGAASSLVSLGTTDPALRARALSPRGDSPRRVAERRAVRLAKRKQTQRLMTGLPANSSSRTPTPSSNANASTVQSLAVTTRRFREHRAARHDAIRRETEREIEATLRAAGEAHAEETRAALHEQARALDRRRDWHAGRARGQGDRFERVAACGEGKARATCHACGDEHDLPVRCDVWRVCVSCRAKAAIERRARFGRGRVRALRVAHRTGRLSRFRRGRWTEKHMTLTVPHVVGATDLLDVGSLGVVAPAPARTTPTSRGSEGDLAGSGRPSVGGLSRGGRSGESSPNLHEIGSVVEGERDDDETEHRGPVSNGASYVNVVAARGP